MKRKLFIALFTLCSIFGIAFCAMTFSACLKDSGNGDHAHEFGGWTINSLPTCTENGEIERRCECGFAETGYIDALGHDEITIEGIQPTCRKMGLTDGKYCIRCETTTVQQVVAEKTPHVQVDIEDIPATCSSYGYTGGKRCAVCALVTRMATRVDKLPHTEVDIEDVAPTCSSYGHTGGKHCGVCGTVTEKPRQIEKLEHTEVIDPAVPATCSSYGHTEGKHCSVCGTVTVPYMRTSKTAHTEVTVPGIPATCTTYGYSESKYCSVCNTVTAERKLTDMLPHEYGTDNFCGDCGHDGLDFIKIDSQSYGVRSDSSLKNATTIYIPEKHNGIPVTEITANAFTSSQNLVSVIMPDTIVKIGSMAFASCPKLENIQFSANLETIQGSVFYQCDSLNNLVLPQSIKNIGNNAFRHCTSLTEITIPSSMESIGLNAFYGCTALKCVTLKDTDGWICNDIKFTCSQLSDPEKNAVYFTDTYLAYSWQHTDEHFHDYLGDNICDICGYDLLSYTLNDDNKGYTVSGRLLAGNGIESVNIPEEHLGLPVTAIEAHTFSNLKTLKSVTIPDTVTSIGALAFSNCVNLTSVFIPANVKTINPAAFMDCDNLSDITISEGVEYIGPLAFSGCAIKNIVIPESVTQIAIRVFSFCNSLESVIFANTEGWNIYNSRGVTKQFTATELSDPKENARLFTDTYMYYNWWNENGEKPKIPDHTHYFNGWTTVIEPTCTSEGLEESYCECRERSTRAIPTTEHTFGEWHTALLPTCTSEGLQERLCEICTETEQQTIPTTAHNYNGDNICDDCGHDAFTYTLSEDGKSYTLSKCEYNKTIKEIVIPATHNGWPVTAIGDRAFMNCSFITKVTFPDGLLSIGQAAFGACHGLTEIAIPDTVTYMGSSAFNACSTLSKINIPKYITEIPMNVLQNTQITSVVIPAGVKKIGYAAFSGCKYLSEVIFEGNVETIDGVAFADCDSLTTITLPDSVTEIGLAAFAGCINLTDIKLGKNLKIIGDAAFDGCTSLPAIKLPSTVTTIGMMAFYNCKALTEIVIPASTTYLSDHLFEGCESLKGVIFEDPTGWACYLQDTLKKEFTAEELSDPERNLEYFKDTCKWLAWIKGENI